MIRSFTALALAAVSLTGIAQTTHCTVNQNGSFTGPTMDCNTTPAGPSLYDKKTEQQRQLGETIGNNMAAMAAITAARRAELMDAQAKLASVLLPIVEGEKHSQCVARGAGSIWTYPEISDADAKTFVSEQDEKKRKKLAKNIRKHTLASGYCTIANSTK